MYSFRWCDNMENNYLDKELNKAKELEKVKEIEEDKPKEVCSRI